MAVFSALVRVITAVSGAGSPPSGSLRRVDPAGGHPTIAGGLFAPYWVAVHEDAACVSVCAVCPDRGAVIRVPLG
jgi:hypothetical protein